MKTYKAIATNSAGKKQIIEMKYATKADFIHDLRANGYKVSNYNVKIASEFDRLINTTNCKRWEWK